MDLRAGPTTTTGDTGASRLGAFHRLRLDVAVSGVALGASYLVASRDAVPDWELRLTDRINDAPEGVTSVLYPVMQLGTVGGPLVVAAAIVWWRRDWILAATTVATGVATWFLAKGVKRIVDRDRPSAFLPEISVREGDGTGLGYLSGHSAVAAGAAVMAMVAMPPRWRPVAAAVAGLVGVARIVHGVHFPADVVGGWAFGALMSFGALAMLDVIGPRTASRPDAEPR